MNPNALRSEYRTWLAEVRSAGRGASEAKLIAAIDGHFPLLVEYANDRSEEALDSGAIARICAAVVASGDKESALPGVRWNGAVPYIAPPRFWRWGLGFACTAAVLFLVLWLAGTFAPTDVPIAKPSPPPKKNSLAPIPDGPEHRDEAIVNKGPEVNVDSTKVPKKPDEQDHVATLVEEARIGEIVGEPILFVPGAERGVSVRTGMVLPMGSRIETGDLDRAEILMADGTELRLDYASVLTIPIHVGVRDPNVEKVGQSQRLSYVSLERGTLRASVKHLDDNRQFQVRTKAATAEVLGTIFVLEVKPNSGIGKNRTTARLLVESGRVKFFNAFGAVVASDFTETSATNASAPSPPIRSTTLRLFRLDGTSFVRTTLLAGGLGTHIRGLATPVGWLGINVNSLPLPPEVLHTGIPIIGFGANSPSRGARVSRVDPKYASASAELKVGDVISRIDSVEIKSEQDFYAATLPKPGSLVLVEFSRDGQIRTVWIMVERLDKGMNPDLDRSEMSEVESATRPLLEGKPYLAARQLQKLAEKLNSAAAYCNLGVTYQVLQRPHEAKKNFQIAVELSSSTALYHRNLAEALRLTNEIVLACKHGEIAAGLAPTSSFAQARYGQELALANRLSEALSFAEKSVRLDAHNSEAWRYLGGVCINLGKEKESDEAFLKAISVDPTSSLAHAERARALRVRGRLDEAIAAAKSAIEIDPIWPGALNTLASASRAKNDSSMAERAWKAAVAVDPESAVWLSNLALLYRTTGRLSDAERAYLKVLKLEPDFQSAYLGLEAIYKATGRLPMAIEILRRAVLNIANVPDNSVHLASHLVEEKELKEAELVLRNAIRSYPLWSNGYPVLIDLLEMQSRSRDAGIVKVRWIASNPRTVQGLADLAKFLAVRGERLPYAEVLIRKALALAPRNPAVLDRLGYIQFRRGDHVSAQTTLELSTQLFSPTGRPAAEAFLHLGLVYDALHRRSESISTIERALKIDPNYPEAKELLEKLRKG